MVDQSSVSDALVAWLKDQITEDERIALAASPAPWSSDDMNTTIVSAAGRGERLAGVVICAVGAYNKSLPNDADAAHILNHDPARVLREVAAKRAHIERYEHVAKLLADWAEPSAIRHELLSVRAANWLVLLHDASVYADRSGYLDSWRPE